MRSVTGKTEADPHRGVNYVTGERALIMTIETKLGRLSGKQFRAFGTVRVVTCRAHSAHHGRMHILLPRKEVPVVTVLTKVRHVRRQQFRHIRGVGVVTGSASHRQGRMFRLFRKDLPVMALVAQSGLSVGKSFRGLSFKLMGYIARINIYVTRFASHLYSRMDIVLLHHGLMAHETVSGAGRGRKSILDYCKDTDQAGDHEGNSFHPGIHHT